MLSFAECWGACNQSQLTLGKRLLYTWEGSWLASMWWLDTGRHSSENFGRCQAKAGTELSWSLASQTGSRHNVTSLVGKEQELVWEVEQYQLDMADLTDPAPR